MSIVLFPLVPSVFRTLSKTRACAFGLVHFVLLLWLVFMLSLMFSPRISIGNRWQLKFFFVLTSSPPLLYGVSCLLKICPVPHENLLLLVHPWLLDSGTLNFNVREFKFTGAPPWFFSPVRTPCVFLSKLVEASHSPSELHCSALKHERVDVPSVPICIYGFKSSEGVGSAAVFPDFDVFISLPVVASIFTAELYAIFLSPFSHFVPRR